MTGHILVLLLLVHVGQNVIAVRPNQFELAFLLADLRSHANLTVTKLVVCFKGQHELLKGLVVQVRYPGALPRANLLTKPIFTLSI